MNKSKDRTIKNKKKTGFWDFLIALGSGIVNLLKIEKIICIIILYLLGRDFYFTKNIDNSAIYENNIISASEILKLILENNNNDIIYISIIIILLITILIMIIVIRCVYVREINRLVKDRRRLMHDIEMGNFTPLKNHNSSEEDKPL